MFDRAPRAKPAPVAEGLPRAGAGLTRAAALSMVPPVGPYASYVLQTIVTLLAVCAIAFVVLYGARRLGVGRPRGPIELVGLLPLDARRAIYLVKVAGQVLVVGASESGFTKLGELAAADLPGPEAAVAAFGKLESFHDVLARILGRGIRPGAAGHARPEVPPGGPTTAPEDRPE